VARRLAAGGDHVILHGRDVERGSALVSQIEEQGSGSARFYTADLSSFDEVRALARAIRRDYDRLDVLVNNAGIWLQGPRRVSDGRAYAQSKLAQVMFTFDLAAELDGTGVTANALHPATMMDTDMVLERGAQTRSSVQDGAEEVLNLVNGTDLGSGGYFNPMTPARANDQAYDQAARARLRALSERLTGGG